MWVRPIQGGGPWLLAEWQIAVLGSDGNSDTAASAVDGVDFPVHALAIGIAAFRIARYVLWPFGRTIGRRPGAGGAAVIGDAFWIILFGWWLALGHLVSGVLLCLTIVGIPLGIDSFKIIPVTLLPLGVRIMPADRAYTEVP